MRRIIAVIAFILLVTLAVTTLADGTLMVAIDPADARNQGAQWKLTSGPDTNYHASGITVSNIPTGEYTLFFKTLPGWTIPTSHNSTVSITNGNNYRIDTYGFNLSPPTVVTNGDYHHWGYLKTILWSQSAGATAYELWRNTRPETGAAIRIGGDIVTTNYFDNSGQSPNRYYYWVKAKNSAGISGFSELTMVVRNWGSMVMLFGGDNTNGRAIPCEESFEEYPNNHLLESEPGWYRGSVNDISWVQKETNSYPGVFPLNALMHTNILFYETATDSGGVSNIFSMSTFSNVYLDVMIKPGAVQEPDTSTLLSDVANSNCLFAIFVDTNDHVNIWNQWLADDRDQCSNAWTILTSPVVDSIEWMRITIALDYRNSDGSGRNFMRIKINNGDWITNAIAYKDIGNYERGGSYFLCANQGLSNSSLHSLNTVTFQGVGFVDDLKIDYAEPPNVIECVTGISFIAGNVRIEWQGDAAVTQFLERCFDLSTNPPAWAPVFTNIRPSTTTTNYTDPLGTNDQVYYRVRNIQ